MSKRRRSTRRHRREPVRRPIPAAPQSTTRPVRSDDLMPTREYSPVFGLLTKVTTEMVPLHAVLAVLHQALSGKPVGSGVLSCHQIAGALPHLGFDAGPMAACATVYRTTDTFAEVSEIGTRKRPPTVRPDGTTDGHVVVWTPSFSQLVDATLVQDPDAAVERSSGPGVLHAGAGHDVRRPGRAAAQPARAGAGRAA